VLLFLRTFRAEHDWHSLHNHRCENLKSFISDITLLPHCLSIPLYGLRRGALVMWSVSGVVPSHIKLKKPLRMTVIHLGTGVETNSKSLCVLNMSQTMNSIRYNFCMQNYWSFNPRKGLMHTKPGTVRVRHKFRPIAASLSKWRRALSWELLQD
jgi:hypothetical protein